MAVLKIWNGTTWVEVPGGGDVSAAASLTDNAIVCGDGGAKGVQTRSATINDSGVVSIPGIGDGGLTNYDMNVGDVVTPSYGMVRIGNSVFGRTSYKAGNIDLDGTVILRNIGGPVTSEIEFVWTESTGDTCRFALPRSAVGNATYNSRSMLLAGPAPADTDFVKVTYWQNQGIFHNLACDTDGEGADLGVQNDLEVEGDIFADNIEESTTAAGVTVDGVLLKDGLVDGRDVATAIMADGTQPLTAPWDAGAFEIRALTFQSDVVTGTQPYVTASTTKNTNLHADLLDGLHVATSGSAIPDMSAINTWTTRQLMGTNQWWFFRDTSQYIHSSAANILDLSGNSRINFRIAGTTQLYLTNFGLFPATDDDLDLGTVSLRFENAYFSKRILSGQTTLAADTDNLAVNTVNSVLVDTSGGNVTIGGLRFGAAGQIVHIVKVNDANSMIIENDEAAGNQEIFTPDGADMTFTTRGGVTVVCDGSVWHVVAE